MAAPGLAEEVIARDEEAVTAEFITFLKAATAKRYGSGARRRFNQARETACVDAEFTILDNLRPEYRVGLFAMPHTYAASIRFANAASTSDRERDLRGMTVRVSGVDRPNLTPGVTVQDIVMNSHPVMMTGDTRGFLELLQANEAGGFRRSMYFLTHPKALRIALAARANPTCHLDIPYWSTTPYLFGPGRAVKYAVAPTSQSRAAARRRARPRRSPAAVSTPRRPPARRHRRCGRRRSRASAGPARAAARAPSSPRRTRSHAPLPRPS